MITDERRAYIMKRLVKLRITSHVLCERDPRLRTRAETKKLTSTKQAIRRWEKILAQDNG